MISERRRSGTTPAPPHQAILAWWCFPSPIVSGGTYAQKVTFLPNPSPGTRAPWCTGSQDPENALENTTIVHPRNATRLVGQHRLDCSPFMVGEQRSSTGSPSRNAAISRRSDAEQDSEQFRFAPRTWLALGGTVQSRKAQTSTIMLFRAEGRENMIADRAYSPGSLPFMDRRASLFYFAAAVPAVGFVHGRADVNPLNEAMLESYAESCFMNHRARLDTVAYRAD